MLLKRLGEISAAPLADNARAFGLSGRGAVTLDALFQQRFDVAAERLVVAKKAPAKAAASIEVLVAP